MQRAGRVSREPSQELQVQIASEGKPFFENLPAQTVEAVYAHFLEEIGLRPVLQLATRKLVN